VTIGPDQKARRSFHKERTPRPKVGKKVAGAIKLAHPGAKLGTPNLGHRRKKWVKECLQKINKGKARKMLS